MNGPQSSAFPIDYGEESNLDLFRPRVPPLTARAATPAPDEVLGKRGPSRRSRGIALQLGISDVLCLVAALLASQVLRFGHATISLHLIGPTLMAVAAWSIGFASFGLYRPQLLSTSEELRRTISATSVGALIIIATFWSRFSLSQTWVVLWCLQALVLELGTRRAWRWHQARERESGRLSLRALIVGANGEAQTIGHSLMEAHSGFEPVGYLSVDPASASADTLPTLGDIEHLESVIQDYSVNCVFVAPTDVGPGDVLRVVHAARRAGIEVRVSATVPETLASRVTVQQIGSTTLLALRPVWLTGRQRAFKRAFDLILATAALGISLPIWFLVAPAIRLTSRGPALFRQQRVTAGGRIFTIFKFRTMRQGADRVSTPEVDPTIPYFKLATDPRLTRVGKVLRRFSLDELPQLINIIRGDMSLVGPRPLAADQVARIPDGELLSYRHEVLAGLTGWWQIHGRNDVSPDQAMRLDLFYIENWSPTLDLYILMKTLGAVVTGKGAY